MNNFGCTTTAFYKFLFPLSAIKFPFIFLPPCSVGIFFRGAKKVADFHKKQKNEEIFSEPTGEKSGFSLLVFDPKKRTNRKDKFEQHKDFGYFVTCGDLLAQLSRQLWRSSSIL